MTVDTLAGVTDEMLEAAMAWRLRLSEPHWSADDEAELEVWLQADERHARAFERTGQVWAFFDQHATSPELLSARRALLGRVQRQARGRWTGPAAIVRAPSRRVALGAMAAALVVGVGIWPLATQGDVYRTGVGERRVITLADGSVVTLDAMSKVAVRYSRGQRRLVLRQGQARFDVAKDLSRPFTVTARDRNVVATGTAFNIDMIEPEVRVTLIEGRVLVMPTESRVPLVERRGGKTVELHPGQALVASRDAAPQLVRTADLGQATAWQDGKLMFDREPLGEAVERINRYSDRKITVADARAAAVPVSGVFNAGDANAFLEAVNGFLAVRVVQGPDGVVLQSTEGAS
jgi:transmembrane sensor